jgi:hypothetical protein
MSYGIYYVFITALISSYEDMVIAALVKAGFQVGSLSETHEVTIATKDSVSALIALRIDSEKHNAFELHGEVEKVLNELNILYYSLIVTESTDCAWNISNIRITKALPAAPIPAVNVKKSKSGLN